MACCSADNGWKLKSSGCMWHDHVRLEVGIIDPHPMKDHTDTPGQGDHSLLDGLVGTEHGTDFLRRNGFAVNGPEPGKGRVP
ncbi:hypothetical protein [uncultured Thioclava sp.]|uniref:hypothetical protein n=1 Tax=uncultured Thioclava sp. TaxID=473858 RepID=UPI0025F1D2A7|nr:hypothetical protein [uncultured Thioclava sp.]